MQFLCVKCRDPRRVLKPDDPYFPFCSRQCRDRDLGAWINEEYRVGGTSGAGDLNPGADENFDRAR